MARPATNPPNTGVRVVRPMPAAARIAKPAAWRNAKRLRASALLISAPGGLATNDPYAPGAPPRATHQHVSHAKAGAGPVAEGELAHTSKPRGGTTTPSAMSRRA